MNKLFTLLLLLIQVFNVRGQVYYPFPSDSASWTINYSCQVPFCPPGVLVQPGITSQKGDTILNGILYHKLYEKTSGYILNSFYREANKKIYSKFPLGGVFGNDTSEFMLYDFNMAIGDSFVVKVPSSWISASGPLVKQPVIYLSSTGTISVNSIAHKTYYFTSNNCTSCPINVQWIEGVGTTSGFFYNLNYRPWASCISYPAPYYIYLLCFERNYYNFPYTSGGCTLGMIEHKPRSNIHIYPNPFINSIHLSELYEPNEVELLTAFGQKLPINLIKTETGSILNTATITPGIYFLRIFSEGVWYSKKLVKTE